MRIQAKSGGRHGGTRHGPSKKIESAIENIPLSGIAVAKTASVVAGSKVAKRARPLGITGVTKRNKAKIAQDLERLQRLFRAAGITASSATIKVRISEPEAQAEQNGYVAGARGRALLRGREQMEALLTEAGGTFTQDQVITMLYGISRQAVDKRVREGSLLAVPGPNGARRYPVCQFLADGSLIKGLKEVQAALPVRGPWSAFLFLMQPHDGLEGRKPLDLLREGDVARVVAAVEGLGVQGS